MDGRSGINNAMIHPLRWKYQQYLFPGHEMVDTGACDFHLNREDPVKRFLEMHLVPGHLLVLRLREVLPGQRQQPCGLVNADHAVSHFRQQPIEASPPHTPDRIIPPAGTRARKF
jgi:hypothetical protein